MVLCVHCLDEPFFIDILRFLLYTGAVHLRIIKMRQVTYTKARQGLSNILTEVCSDHVPVYITRKNGDRAVIISADEYESMDETAYLLRSEANRKELMESIAQADRGETVPIGDLMKELDI